jgi:hypothetical protein
MAFQQLEDSIRNILKRLGVLENTPPATVADASSTVRGIVELATSAEAIAGTDSTKAVTATGLAASRLRPTQGVIPSSVAVGSGSATVDSDGLITFTGVSSLSLNDVFDGLGGDAYEVYVNADSGSGGTAAHLRLRSGGTDLATNSYRRTAVYSKGSGVTQFTANSSVSFCMLSASPGAAGGQISGRTLLSGPGKTQATTATHQSTAQASSLLWIWNEAAVTLNTIAYDGLTLMGDPDNLTGTMKVVKIS